jgi:hypothetical protein
MPEGSHRARYGTIIWVAQAIFAPRHLPHRGGASAQPNRVTAAGDARLARRADVVYITSCPCKNDPTGAKFGNHPVPSTYHSARFINLARELVRYELARQIDAGQRHRAPLILSPRGACWGNADLDKLFKALLLLVAPPEQAKQLTIHSFRVWLACALLEAGATPEQSWCKKIQHFKEGRVRDDPTVHAANYCSTRAVQLLVQVSTWCSTYTLHFVVFHTTLSGQRQSGTAFPRPSTAPACVMPASS